MAMAKRRVADERSARTADPDPDTDPDPNAAAGSAGDGRRPTCMGYLAAKEAEDLFTTQPKRVTSWPTGEGFGHEPLGHMHIEGFLCEPVSLQATFCRFQTNRASCCLVVRCRVVGT